MGVSFDFHDTVVKIGKALNTKRITRIQDKCRKTGYYSNAGCLVHLQLDNS
jgi:hypothetical protein